MAPQLPLHGERDVDAGRRTAVPANDTDLGGRSNTIPEDLVVPVAQFERRDDSVRIGHQPMAIEGPPNEYTGPTLQYRLEPKGERRDARSRTPTP